jgi:hypothetical protein
MVLVAGTRQDVVNEQAKGGLGQAVQRGGRRAVQQGV